MTTKVQYKVTYKDKTVVRDSLTAGMSDAVGETGDTLRLRTVPFGMGSKRVLEIMPNSRERVQASQAAFVRALELKQKTNFSPFALAARDFNVVPGQVDVGYMQSIDTDLYDDAATSNETRVDIVNGMLTRETSNVFKIEVIEPAEIKEKRAA